MNTTPAPSSPSEPLLPGFGVLLILAVLIGFFVHIGHTEIIDVNEAQRLLPALEMRESGNFIVPTMDGNPYLAKPPLIYWLIAASYSLFGVSIWAGRLVVALSCAFTIGLVYAVGRREFGRNAGILAAIIMATVHYYVGKGTTAEIDGALTGALFAALYLLWRAMDPSASRRVYCLQAGVFLGMAMLLKGPVVFPFLLAALVAAAVARGAIIRPLVCILIATAYGLAIFLPWVFALIAQMGFDTVWQTLREESLNRVTTSTDINSGGPFYYVVGLIGTFMPWTPLLLYYLSRPIRRHVDRLDAFHRFCWVFVLVATVLFTLISGKEVEYLLPVFPFLALMAGAVFAEVVRENRRELWWAPMACMWTVGIAGLVIPLAGIIPAARWLYASGALVALLVLGALASALTLRMLWENRRIAALGAALLALVCMRESVVYAKAERDDAVKSYAPLSAEIHHIASERGIPVFHWGISRRPHVLWYVRDISVANEDLAPWFAHPTAPSAIIVLRKKHEDEFLEQYGNVAEIETSRKTQHRGEMYLVVSPKNK